MDNRGTAAYLEMPFYSGGTLLEWLAAEKPSHQSERSARERACCDQSERGAAAVYVPPYSSGRPNLATLFQQILGKAATSVEAASCLDVRMDANRYESRIKRTSRGQPLVWACGPAALVASAGDAARGTNAHFLEESFEL